MQQFVYKLSLSAEQLMDERSRQDLVKIIYILAKEIGIDIVKEKELDFLPTREIIFYDTKKYDLYHNGFILRKRTYYKKKSLTLSHKSELTLKFRHQDKIVAAAKHMHSKIADETIKFKEQILADKSESSGMRHLYSHSCTIKCPELVVNEKIQALCNVYPVLCTVPVEPKSPLQVVNNLTIEESILNVGEMDFGKKITGRAVIIVWRNQETKVPLIGEFELRIKLGHISTLPEKTKKLAESFYTALQSKANDWLKQGVTKTSLIYQLSNSK